MGAHNLLSEKILIIFRWHTPDIFVNFFVESVDFYVYSLGLPKVVHESWQNFFMRHLEHLEGNISYTNRLSYSQFAIFVKYL